MNHADEGGAALALIDLIIELKKIEENYEPVVITGKNNDLNKKFSQLGIENYSFQFKNFMSSYRKPEILIKLLLKARYNFFLKREIKKIEEKVNISDFDIIHTNLNRIDVGAIIAQKYGVPHVWHVREHGESDFKLMSVKSNPIKYMNSFDSIFIAISESVKNTWLKRGLNPNKIFTIYDGVRTELYKVKNKKNEKKINIIFLGGYTKNKGQDEIVEALNLLDKAYIDYISIDFFGNGDKKFKKKLIDRVKSYGLDDTIKFNDYDKKIYKRIPQYDVGLTCSNAEGFGRVTVEYMLSGLCPIVSNTGANQELVEDGINGIVYEKGNINMLCHKIEYIINNRNLIKKYGENARKHAFEKFSMECHANSIWNIYERILNGDLR